MKYGPTKTVVDVGGKDLAVLRRYRVGKKTAWGIGETGLVGFGKRSVEHVHTFV
jgi:hypothetical protein